LSALSSRSGVTSAASAGDAASAAALASSKLRMVLVICFLLDVFILFFYRSLYSASS